MRGPNDDLGIWEIVSKSIYCSAYSHRVKKKRKGLNVYKKVRESAFRSLVYFYVIFFPAFRLYFLKTYEISLERVETLLGNQVEVRRSILFNV